MSKVNLKNDPLLFPVLKGSKDPDEELFRLRSKLENKVIKSVGRHGKYFWLRLRDNELLESTVLLMHFGMTGMIKLRNVKSHLIFMENGGDSVILKELKEEKIKKEVGNQDDKPPSGDGVKREAQSTVDSQVKEEEITPEKEEEWPPRFSKFELELTRGTDKIDFSFTDPRRLGRVRLLEGPEIQTDKQLMDQDPLVQLGPDYLKSPTPVETKDQFTSGDPDPLPHGRPRLDLEQFSKLVLSKRTPIKSLLLDQRFFAGVGNWMGDEILYHAKIYPNEVLGAKIEPESSTGGVHPKIADLYNALIYVCEYSVLVEGDVRRFPANWLMMYRWGKRRKSAPKLKTAEGYQVDHITVGGRTACYVPDIQRPIAAHARAEFLNTSPEGTPSKKRKRV